MRRGNFTLPQERIKRYESDLITVDSTNGNVFYHGFGYVPAIVEVRFVCVTAANGYTVGQEIPENRIIRRGTGDSDGVARSAITISDQAITVLCPSTDRGILDSTGTSAAVTITNFKLKVRCLDALPIS